jgi:hypothetical protein
MLLTTREVSNHILSFKFNSTYQFVDLLVRKSSDVVHSPISQEQLIRPDTLLIRRVTSADVHPPLLAKEVVTPTLVVAVVTVTHKFLPVASEFVDERDAAHPSARCPLQQKLGFAFVQTTPAPFLQWDSPKNSMLTAEAAVAMARRIV